jgi:two-component system, OmpR family, response regulator BaeR
MTSRHILIVEDEPKIAALVRDYLHADGYTTSWLASGSDAVEVVRNTPPDLIILDLMLPGKDGLSICREVRAFSVLPIIMLTARVEEIDRLLGLELGADDYICKPFSPREVVARVKACLRRAAMQSAGGGGGGGVDNVGMTAGGSASQTYGGLAFQAPIKIDADRFSATLGSTKLDLTPVEFRLLTTLASQPGRVFSRNQLMDALYVDHRVVSDRTVDSHVKNLRRKVVEAGGEGEWLRSIYGVGYRIEWS